MDQRATRIHKFKIHVPKGNPSLLTLAINYYFECSVKSSLFFPQKIRLTLLARDHI